jgi:hypothetical protein
MKITRSQLRRIIKEEIECSLSEIENTCWDGYSPGGAGGPKTKKGKDGNRVANCEEISEDTWPSEGKSFDKDKMKCNKKRYLKKGETGYGKQQKVVKACDDGKERIVKFGSAKMRNNKDKPKNRKSFRSRMNCDTPGSKLKARYWACKDW